MGRPVSILFKRSLDAIPHTWRRILHRDQKFCLLSDVSEVLDQVGANRTRGQMLLLLSGAATLNDLGQVLLKFGAIHKASLSPQNLYRLVRPSAFVSADDSALVPCLFCCLTQPQQVA